MRRRWPPRRFLRGPIRVRLGTRSKPWRAAPRYTSLMSRYRVGNPDEAIRMAYEEAMKPVGM